MRVTYVIQRYGREVVGGGESFCRHIVTRLAARGHDVTVLTSRVKDMYPMVDEYPEGPFDDEGVTVDRLSSHGPCDPYLIRHTRKIAFANRSGKAEHHYAWQRAMGPLLPELGRRIEADRPRIDVLVPVTQFYFPANEAILTATPLGLPTLFHPLAHDDGTIEMSLFQTVYRSASAFGFLTEEEEALVRDKTGARQPGFVHGVGVDLAPEVDDAGADALDLPSVPYVCFVGRTEQHKLGDVIDFMARFRARHGRRVELVTVGPTMPWLERVPDVRRLGFQSDGVRNAVIARSLGLVMPSPYESFSMVLTEAWALRRPALVNGRCGPLRGQATRSGGAFAYDGYEDFEAGLLRLLDEPGTADAMGAAGRAYVEERYDWDHVMDRYEDMLERVAGRARGSRRTTRPTRSETSLGRPAAAPVPVPPARAPEAEPAPAALAPVAVLVVAEGGPVPLLDVLEGLEGQTLDGAPFHVLIDASSADADTVGILDRLEGVSIAAVPGSPCLTHELREVLTANGFRHLVRLTGAPQLTPGWWRDLASSVDDGGPVARSLAGGRADALALADLPDGGVDPLALTLSTVAFRPDGAGAPAGMVAAPSR